MNSSPGGSALNLNILTANKILREAQFYTLHECVCTSDFQCSPLASNVSLNWAKTGEKWDSTACGAYYDFMSNCICYTCCMPHCRLKLATTKTTGTCNTAKEALDCQRLLACLLFIQAGCNRCWHLFWVPVVFLGLSRRFLFSQQKLDKYFRNLRLNVENKIIDISAFSKLRLFQILIPFSAAWQL